MIDISVSNAKSTPHRFSARPDMTTLPLSHPDRTDAGFRPLKALHHFRRLIADKEDTEQVFHIIDRSEEHTSELQSLMRISYAVFCLKKKNKHNTTCKQNNNHII